MADDMSACWLHFQRAVQHALFARSNLRKYLIVIEQLLEPHWWWQLSVFSYGGILVHSFFTELLYCLNKSVRAELQLSNRCSHIWLEKSFYTEEFMVDSMAGRCPGLVAAKQAQSKFGMKSLCWHGVHGFFPMCCCAVWPNISTHLIFPEDIVPDLWFIQIHLAKAEFQLFYYFQSEDAFSFKPSKQAIFVLSYISTSANWGLWTLRWSFWTSFKLECPIIPWTGFVCPLIKI